MSVLRAALVDLRPLGVEAPVAPRLPTLERLLAQADVRGGPAHWRRFAGQAFGLALQGGQPPVAATIAAAAGLSREETWYVATPVHLVAGLSHVRLHPAGPLALAADVRAALVRAHAQAFAGTGTMLADTPHGLLWHGARGLPADTLDPDPYTGQDIEPALPRGAGAASLRRDMTELQMWLHGEPVAFGATLAPNGLWLWGAAGEAAGVPTRLPLLESADAYLNALASLAPPGTAGVADAVATYRLGDLGAEGDAFALAEQRYFAGLAAAIGSRRYRRVELWFGGRIYVLARHQALRFWRRSVPWWQGEPA